MRELGYSCTASADAFRALLSQFRNLDEQAVAGVLGLLAATHKGLEPDGLGLADTMRAILGSNSTSAAAAASSAGSGATGWNVNVVMDAIKAAAPSISWPRVAEALDYEGFTVLDAAGFAMLMGAWRRATSEPFPLTAIAGRLWTNTAGQLSLLQQAVAAPPDLLSWERSPKKIQPLEGLGQGKSPLGTPNQAWASIDLLAVLAQMADLPGLSTPVLELLRRGPASQCPEVLVATTSMLRGPSDLTWGSLERFVWGSVAAPSLFESPAAASRRNVLLQRLWQQRRDALLQCMASYKAERPDRVPELLDVVLELKGLSYALDSGPPALAVELACVAAARAPPLVDLDSWLAAVLGKDANSGSVMQATLGFLEAQLAGIAEGRLKVAGSGGRPAPGQLLSVLSAESTTAFLRALYTAGACVVPGLANQLVRVLELAKRAFPGAAAALAAAAASPLSGSAADSGLAGGTGGGAFPEAIELEANSYFQKLYHERQPVDELVQQLKAFKSGTAHQQVVFACMVHNLFDEYRFFPNYPDLELDTTAALFGALLHHQLLTNITLGMALRHVLQALGAPPSSKMFRFGLGAIRQFQPELNLWPKFCEHALAIPHLKAADPALWALMEKVVAAAGPSSGSSSSGGAADAGDLTSSGGGPSPAATAAAAGSGAAAGGAAAAAAAASSSVPNGTSSGSTGGSNPGKGAEQQPAQQPGARGGAAGGAAAAGRLGAAAGRDGAANGPQQQQGGKAAAGAAGGKGGAGGAAGGSVGSVDTADNLRDLMNNAGVAQAAATMALNDKPERMTLNMTLNNETLDTAERKLSSAVAPGDTLTDKVSFLMNNLTVDNMPVKSKELGNVMLPKYVEWFANYLVVRRAAQEPNHHKTYVFLLDTLGHKDLSKAVLKTTYYYCRALLESDRAITQTNERTLIKQLGMWLGLLTFAKNKPVLAKDMDLKALIQDAYTRGRMIAVLPFVEKVLAGCKDTKVFRHTNPMIAGILSMMAEIHAMPRLKLNISFVIEMTFKTFEVSLNDVCPSTVLRDLPRVQLHNPDFSALPEAPKAPTGAALHAPLVPPGAPPALTPPPSLAAAAGAAGAAAAAGAAGAPPGTPPQAGAGAEAGKGPAASPAAQQAMAAGAGASPAPAAASAEPGLLTKLHMYVQISPQLAPLAERLQLKRLVPVAVDRAMCDIITPVVERSVTIACMTTYELVTKDYATDPDEARLRQAAHLMVSSLAGSLALVTCKEPLRVSLSNQLRSMLQQLEPNTLEQAVQLLVNDNLDLGCTIIERAATDKAVRDIDKSLAAQYEARANARRNGLDFYKHSLMQQQQAGPFPAGLPESLTPKPGNLAQQRVYEDFGRLPRGQPLAARYGEGGVPPGSPLQAGMDGSGAPAGAAGPALADSAKGAMGPPLPEGSALHGAALIEGLMNWTTQADAAAAAVSQRDANATWEAVAGEFGPVLAAYREMLGGNEEVTLFCAKRVIKRTWEQAYLNRVHAGLHAEALSLCAAALGGPESLGGRRLQAEVTAYWVQLNSEAKFNRDVAEAFIRKGLFLLPEMDAYVAKMLLQTRTQALGDFAILLGRSVRDGLAGFSDVTLSLDLLGKLSAASPASDTVLQLLSAARASSRQRAAARAGLPDMPGLKDKSDPPGFQQQVAQLFEDFARRAMATPEEKAHAGFVGQLRSSGLLNMDEATDRMLRILVELAVNHCLQSEAPVPRADGSNGPGPLSFLAVDPLVKLIVCLVTAHGGGEAFLDRSLAITVCLLRRDAEDKAGAFNGRPYLRLLLGLASELAPVEEAAAAAAAAAASDKAAGAPAAPRYLRCLGLALLMVQPAAVPGFAYGYLEMISHRVFMPRLLIAPGAAGWPLYEALLVGLLHFLEPALRAAELAEPLRLLYKGTLRLLLVLLHDFPEFLCEHQFRLCEVIPTPAIQMRNLVLSAFPRNMRLPDPFTPNLKVDLLPEISQPPRGIPPADKLLPRPLRALVDSMLASLAASPAAQQQQRPAGQTPPPAAALPAGSMQQLVSMLQAPADSTSTPQQQQQQAGAGGGRYHLPLLAGLVLYVAAAGQPGAPVQPGSPALELLGRLIAELEPQGRYLLLNAVANQLRYPNAHTHYFSCVLLALFQGAPRDAQGEEVRAQVTRVLLERLIVNRPHPWGLLITFIELIKNPRYNFWAHNFTRCAPEIERLFESVARSCMGPNAAAVAAAAAGGKGLEGGEVEAGVVKG